MQLISIIYATNLGGGGGGDKNKNRNKPLREYLFQSVKLYKKIKKDTIISIRTDNR